MPSVIVFALLTALAPFAQAQPAEPPGSWTALAPGAPFQSGAVATDGISLYAYGGEGGANTLRRYDPELDAWQRLPDLPVQVTGNCGAYWGGSLYSFGGVGPAMRFDLASGVWSVLPQSDTSLYAVGGRTVETTTESRGTETITTTTTTTVEVSFASAAAVGSKIYITGGVVAITTHTVTTIVDSAAYGGGGTTVTSVTTISGGITDATTEFDPVTVTYTPRAPCPLGGVAGHASAALNGKLYAVIGDVCVEYDPATDVWTERARMTLDGVVAAPRSSLAAFTLNERLYAVGGESAGQAIGECLEYDPATDTWRRCAGLTPRFGLGAVAIGSHGYAYGGGVRLASPGTLLERFTLPQIHSQHDEEGDDARCAGAVPRAHHVPAAAAFALLIAACRRLGRYFSTLFSSPT